MHEPQGIGRFRWNFGAPERERRCYPPFEQIGAGDFRFVETPDAGPDLRGGTVRRPGEETAVGGPDTHAIAGVRCSADLGDRAGEDPRMAPQKRALASLLQRKLRRDVHGRIRAFQTQPARPSRPAAPSSQRGWILVARTTAEVTAVIAKAGHEWSAERVMRYPPASIRPTVTGTRPSSTDARRRAPRKRCQILETAKVSTHEGPHTAAVATTAPARPATFQPMRLTTRIFGPGAAWASAKSSANCAPLIHPCTSTTLRCISGSTVIAPPTAISERTEKSIASCARASSLISPSRTPRRRSKVRRQAGRRREAGARARCRRK